MIKTVTIPALEQHEGFHSTTVDVEWTCPKCGGPRGEVFKTISWDGSRRLGVDGWRNPCGHVDSYADVRRESRESAVLVRRCSTPRVLAGGFMDV